MVTSGLGIAATKANKKQKIAKDGKYHHQPTCSDQLQIYQPTNQEAAFFLQGVGVITEHDA